jgi:hypothetical protein
MPGSPFDRKKYMSRAEASQYLGMTWERITRLISERKLVGLQRGHVWYVERASARNLKRNIKRRKST